jgi:hypothetical protein
MALERALRAIRLEETDHIPHWEIISNPDFERSITGIDPYQHPQQSALRMIELLDLDVAGFPETDEPIQPYPEDDLDESGHKVARWGASTSWRWDWGDRFGTEADVLAYRPLDHLDLSGESMPSARNYSISVDDLATQFKEHLERDQALLGKQALSDVPFFYNTFFMWPLLTFGWELFLSTAMQHPEEMRRIMDDFGQLSLKVFTAWSLVGPPLVVAHDDICITRGPVFNPKWLRKNVYPWYERLWEPLHRRGVKLVFMSDGNLDEVADDIFATGADGLFTETYTDLATIAHRYPEKILVGNIDNRVLAEGRPEEIDAEVERCARFGFCCPGYFFSVSNHISYDLRPDNVQRYFNACERFGRR